jgi:hypothetical protein
MLDVEVALAVDMFSATGLRSVALSVGGVRNFLTQLDLGRSSKAIAVTHSAATAAGYCPMASPKCLAHR